MKVENFKRELQDLFEKKGAKPVLSRLKDGLDRNSKIYYQFLFISNDYNTFNDEIHLGTVSHETANVYRSKIYKAILHLIESLGQADLNENYVPSYQEITNPILVLTSNKNRFNYLKEIFQRMNLVELTVQTFEDVGDTQRYDVIILDNQHMPECRNPSDLDAAYKPQIEKMDELIQTTNKMFIYWGEQLFWVRQHRARVHAANSIFALYARIMEMLNYLNAIKI
ncbi:hypothetical protein [Pontibacter sp. G13]|uniref:hypothetical protein n=1 Tax=Pontibacter sp. G13 TaxID=3074898 RepID=UPI0028893CED|nr:hypothetical protein [Pontibacter sp. G13]WNJ17570.1 hypothetical protein RJD25_22195 [Pontibacter sp. G13]